MVEHSAVNRRVVGSSPTRGVSGNRSFLYGKEHATRPLGQAVKTPPFHGGNMGSNPVGVIFLNTLIRGPLAQLVRAVGS